MSSIQDVVIPRKKPCSLHGSTFALILAIHDDSDLVAINTAPRWICQIQDTLLWRGHEPCWSMAKIPEADSWALCSLSRAGKEGHLLWQLRMNLGLCYETVRFSAKPNWRSEDGKKWSLKSKPDTSVATIQKLSSSAPKRPVFKKIHAKRSQKIRNNFLFHGALLFLHWFPMSFVFPWKTYILKEVICLPSTHFLKPPFNPSVCPVLVIEPMNV
jgi:hypothetical protein